MAAKKKVKRSTKKRSGGAARSEVSVRARIEVRPSDDLPYIYANHAEVAQSAHEFVILFTKLPTKANPSQIAAVQETGVLSIEPEAQILLPPTIIDGLIKALETERDKHLAQKEGEQEKGKELRRH